MEVEGQSPPRGGFEEPAPRASQKRKRDPEVDVFQRVVESAGETRVQKRERSAIRRAPSEPLTAGEKAFCRTFLKFLHEQNVPELERLVSDPQVSKSVALHLLQASGMEGAGVRILQGLVLASGGDPCRTVRYLAKWGEASPDMLSTLILMGPEESQKEVAREVMSCIGQRGGLPLAEKLFGALPHHLRPNFEEVRQHLLDMQSLSHQLGGLQLGLPSRGDALL
jgi:hypothetical protein